MTRSGYDTKLGAEQQDNTMDRRQRQEQPPPQRPKATGPGKAKGKGKGKGLSNVKTTQFDKGSSN